MGSEGTANTVRRNDNMKWGSPLKHLFFFGVVLCLPQLGIAQVLCANEPSQKCTRIPTYNHEFDQRNSRECVFKECQPECEEDCIQLLEQKGGRRLTQAQKKEVVRARVRARALEMMGQPQKHLRNSSQHNRGIVWYDQPWRNQWLPVDGGKYSNSLNATASLARKRALQADVDPTPCTNNEKDGKETDVDCGGGECKKCSAGKQCNGGGDCVSGGCNAADKTCSDPAAAAAAANDFVANAGVSTLSDRGECTLLDTVAFCASFSNDIEGCRAAFEDGFGCMPCANYKTFSGYRDLCRTSLQCAVPVIWDGIETKDLQSGCDSPLGAGNVLVPMKSVVTVLVPIMLSLILSVNSGGVDRLF